MPTLLDHFTVVKRLCAPRLATKALRLYMGLLLSAKEGI